MDGRLTRERSAFGRADPRVVAAIKRALEEQQGRSTGTLSRLRRQVGWLLEDAHGPGTVAVPPVATFNRLVRSVAEQEQLALTAASTIGGGHPGRCRCSLRRSRRCLGNW